MEVGTRPKTLHGELGSLTAHHTAPGVHTEWEMRSKPSLQAMSGITKAAIAELKTFNRPPAAVHMAFEAVLVALGHREVSWKECVKFLLSSGRSMILARLLAFDPRTVTPEMLRRMKPFVSEWSPKQVQTCSHAAAPVAMWVHAVYEVSVVIGIWF